MYTLLSASSIMPRVVLSCVLIVVMFLLIAYFNGAFHFSSWFVKYTAKKETNKVKQYAKNEKTLTKLLSFCTKVDSFFLFPLSLSKKDQFDYFMRRFDFTIPYVLRPPTASEFSGFFKIIGLVLSSIGVLLCVYTLNPLSLIFVGSFFFVDVALFAMNMSIMSSDKALEEDFPDLYLFLCPSLLKGSDCHLSGVLSEFSASFDEAGLVAHKDIVGLVTCMNKLIDIYGSELEAIRHLRDYYRTPTVVNFVNLAIQALNGVDNTQKLLAYKQELCQRNLAQMEAKGAALVEKGSKVIWLIFIILGQFVVLSWLAKCGFTIPASW